MAKYTEPVEEQDEGKSPAKYRLPFALCKQYGIKIEEWWTPRDAWNALQGHGVKADDEYAKRRLKEKREKSKERAKQKRQEKKERRNQAKDPEHAPDYQYQHQNGKIAGVSKGTPMSFKEADGGAPNPYYGKPGLFGYGTNCQTCVPVFFARLEGYDVRALPNNGNGYIHDLERDVPLAYIDKSTGKPPKATNSPRGINRAAWLRKTLEEGKTYSMSFAWKGDSGAGHVITVTKQNGQVVGYDPQSGKQIKNIGNYLNDTTGSVSLIDFSKVELNPEYADYIMKGASRNEKH